MKKTLAFVLAAIAAGTFARAEFEMSSDLTFASEYVFRGVKLGDNTLHPSIEVASDSFYAGMWGALPINNQGSVGQPGDDDYFPGWSDEYDFYFGFQPSLSDTVSLDVGLTYYYYPTADRTLEAYVGVTETMGGFTFSGYGYYDFELKNTTFQGSVGYSIPLKSMGSSLDLSAMLGHVSVDDGDSYAYYGVSASVPYKINDNATVSVGLNWASNDLDEEGVDDNFLFWTVGLTIGF